MAVRNSNTDSILFIRKAERHHSGIYEVEVQIENMSDKVTITIQVMGKKLLESGVFSIYTTITSVPNWKVHVLARIFHLSKRDLQSRKWMASLDEMLDL